MNLIHDSWIPVLRNDGVRDLIPPKEISDPSIINIYAPRPDFTGALCQFLIGLLQTGCMPKDMRDWKAKWEKPPERAFLESRFERVASFFELDADGPAFMQDFNLPESESKPISALLIEAPGDKTIRDNLDHFVKGGQVNLICRRCAASSVLTLQINAPSGGVGHRTGIRGGGPLTTLVMPCENDGPASLWQRLWLNVFPACEINDFTRNIKLTHPEALFPWLGETRTSDKKGVDTFPKDAHPLQMYWAMPRRIRLEFSGNVSGPCDLCGRKDDIYATGFRTKNYGVNYVGPWLHPLSPHN
ncbi:MAG: type I-E CRISPR-associated protein Cse1/CasA [Desulfobacteraceae bacterium]|nr:type I-E CRISPR-associated protein Cse1/CasA [Desulfobacteraceae bacterium]